MRNLMSLGLTSTAGTFPLVSDSQYPESILLGGLCLNGIRGVFSSLQIGPDEFIYSDGGGGGPSAAFFVQAGMPVSTFGPDSALHNLGATRINYPLPPIAADINIAGVMDPAAPTIGGHIGIDPVPPPLAREFAARQARQQPAGRINWLCPMGEWTLQGAGAPLTMQCQVQRASQQPLGELVLDFPPGAIVAGDINVTAVSIGRVAQVQNQRPIDAVGLTALSRARGGLWIEQPMALSTFIQVTIVKTSVNPLNVSAGWISCAPSHSPLRMMG